jgi:hypothetical protein
VKKTVLLFALITLACSRGVDSVATTDRVASAQEVSGPRSSAMIVRTAEMQILVTDTAKAIAAVTKSVEASGGYVSNSNVWHQGEGLRANLTLRVPAAQLTPALASIRRIARRVERETVTSADVTQEYVDLESQLRNLEATEVELRELLTVARVNSKKAADVLEVHEQLTTIRGQIEQTRGRMRYLSQNTSYSVINLEIVPDALAPGWQPGRVAREAGVALVKFLQLAGTAAIWFAIFLLPILAVLAAFIALLVRLAKRPRSASGGAPGTTAR